MSNAQALQQSLGISDETLRAGCAVLSPELFKDGLRRDTDGPNTKATVEQHIKTVLNIYAAMTKHPQ